MVARGGGGPRNVATAAHRHTVWLLEVASYSNTVCLSSEPLGVALVSVFQGFSFR